MPLERLTPAVPGEGLGIGASGALVPQPGNEIGEVWFEGPGELELPLLVKFLFTTEKLSVQVHPDDAYAAQHHPIPGEPASRGKTEMWHVLAAQPGARIAAGFRERLSEERVREAALSGRDRGTAGMARSRAWRHILHSGRDGACHRRRPDAVRDPAALRHYVPFVRLRPPAGAAHRAFDCGGPARAARRTSFEPGGKSWRPANTSPWESAGSPDRASSRFHRDVLCCSLSLMGRGNWTETGFTPVRSGTLPLVPPLWGEWVPHPFVGIRQLKSPTSYHSPQFHPL